MPIIEEETDWNIPPLIEELRRYRCTTDDYGALFGELEVRFRNQQDTKWESVRFLRSIDSELVDNFLISARQIALSSLNYLTED